MNKVIEKTNDLIKAFEDSDLIKNLEHYKGKIIVNDNLMNLIKKYNNSSDNYEKMAIKKEIYLNNDYSNYMKYYNELFYYIMMINKKFKEYTDVRSCRL